MAPNSLTDRDMKHVWHPCSQMKDYELFKPVAVKSARGSYIELESGHQIIDAISSWWCKSLGHHHPRLVQALLSQVNCFEHVILANTTNEIIVKLSEKLAKLTTSLDKVFYAGDGSSAVEIAMKMSLHTRVLRGESQKNKFIALENGYHGETTGALSVSDVGIYKLPYQAILFDTPFISPLPYVTSIHDPLWHDCSAYWNTIEKSLAPYADITTAIILEPIVQGAGGMKIYSQDFIKRIRAWATKNNIHLIADEIMTGFGRTGKMLACEHANVEPDFLCLGKGITAGWMPFSAVLTRDDVYQRFYDDYNKDTSFLHSHTYSGNALAASIALEVLNINDELNLSAMANQLDIWMTKAMQSIASATGKITNIRHIGGIIAADLVCDDPKRRLGMEVFQKAMQLGAFLRPIGNTIYWLPPLNTDEETIHKLMVITRMAIEF